jgi:hypothetical protein
MLSMPAPLRLRLEQDVREAVAERYESARTPIERTNCHVVLLADEGRTVTEIAWPDWRRASTPGDRWG